MQVLFNCSTNIVGGAIQNAYNFIQNAINDSEIDWLFLVSPQIYSQCQKSQIFDNRIIVIKKSPSKNIQARQEIIKHEQMFNPDIVYTMAGPAYVRFKNYHVMGISNAYITHARIYTFFVGRNLINAIHSILAVLYQIIYARKADFYFFQTKSSRDTFCKRFFLNKNRTAIVPNAIGNIFVSNKFENKSKKDFINIFCPAAPYPHKCLHMIPKIAYKLNNKLVDIKYMFTLTLPNESSIWKKIKNKALKLKVSHLIKNIGPFDYGNAPRLHHEADVIFIPSILETFSTSFLEAIAAKKPLLVSNLPFVNEICGKYAVYFKPCSTKNASIKLKDIILNYEDYKNNINKNANILDTYGDQKKKYNMIKKLLVQKHKENISNTIHN